MDNRAFQSEANFALQREQRKNEYPYCNETVEFLRKDTVGKHTSSKKHIKTLGIHLKIVFNTKGIQIPDEEED